MQHESKYLIYVPSLTKENLRKKTNNTITWNGGRKVKKINSKRDQSGKKKG